MRRAQSDIDGKFRIALQESRDSRRYMHPAKAVGRRNAKRAARLALQRARRLLRSFSFGENPRAVAVVGSARFSHRESTCGAVEKANAQALFEPLHMRADSGLGDSQPVCRR